MAFQSPAQNYTETRLNLGDLVRLSAYSTYLMRSDSNFPAAGIVKGSVLAIDWALTPAHGQLIVAEIDGELSLRCLLPPCRCWMRMKPSRLSMLASRYPSGAWLLMVAGLGFSEPARE